MMFKIEIEIGNDALRKWPQLLWTLKEVVMKISEQFCQGQIKKTDQRRIMDNNGNSVGFWEVE